MKRYVTRQKINNKITYILTDKPINLMSKIVYVCKKSNLLFTDSKSIYSDWETCYFFTSLENNSVVIKGQLIPLNGGFKPCELDDNYFENLDLIREIKQSYKKETENFFDKTKEIKIMLNEYLNK